MNKFTPGPWESSEADDGHEIRMGTAIESRHSYEAQHIISYNHGLFVDDDLDSPSPETLQYFEAEANAHLIAAAPDLLAAAEECARVMEAHEGKGTAEAIEAFDRAYEKLAAAVHKAKGVAK